MSAKRMGKPAALADVVKKSQRFKDAKDQRDGAVRVAVDSGWSLRAVAEAAKMTPGGVARITGYRPPNER